MYVFELMCTVGSWYLHKVIPVKCKAVMWTCVGGTYVTKNPPSTTLVCFYRNLPKDSAYIYLKSWGEGPGLHQIL